MCGIVGLWNREGIFSPGEVDLLFSEASKRGKDGFGVCVIGEKVVKVYKSVGSYEKDREKFLNWLKQVSPKVGSLLLANFRAQPATEVHSSERNLQPCIGKDWALVHNGVVSDFLVKEVKQSMETEIDSEAIGLYYEKNDRDMKRTMEELSGGFAFVLYDFAKNRLYCVCDYKPLAVGYIRGKGFIVHSSEEAIGELVKRATGCSRCGINVWEDFYYHWQEAYTIREIDLDSGMEREYRFAPRFVTPVIDTKVPGKGEKVIAIVSGGIDSTVTAMILKALGYDVWLLHFDYGQRGEEAERLAVEYLRDEYGFKLINWDLKFMYGNSRSNLVQEHLAIRTHTEDYMKTVDAWVECRNLLFLSVASVIAEQFIMASNLEKVYICAGFISLEEEGFYPDNSQRFVMNFMKTLECGSIVANRIRFVNVLQNLMKYETVYLGDKLGVNWRFTVSCDSPRVRGGGIELCNQCGSTLISKWAFEQAGVKDPRYFYDREGVPPARVKKVSGKVREISLKEVVNRLYLPKREDYERLYAILSEKK